jgi:hypothetical protein
MPVVDAFGAHANGRCGLAEASDWIARMRISTTPVRCDTRICEDGFEHVSNGQWCVRRVTHAEREAAPVGFLHIAPVEGR